MSFLFGSKSKPDLSSKTVVVIGGGMGGCTAIAGLRKVDPNQTAKVILIEPKDHAEIYWATYRSPFDKDVAEKSLVNLTAFCENNKVQHQRSHVAKLTKDSATLEDGTNIVFDVCVVATGAGARWEGMGRGPPASVEQSTREARLAALEKEGDRILKAKHVIVIGGGLIGAELAGDIAEYSKEREDSSTKVTVVHAGPHLCSAVMSETAGYKVKQQMEALGITVHLNEKAKKGDSGKMILSSGEALPDADITIWTTGNVPCNDLLKDLPGALDDKNWIETDEYFRIKGSDGKLFAVGDCTTTLPNAGNQIMQNLDVLGQNLLTTLTSDGGAASEEGLAKFVEGPGIYLTTVGRAGVFYVKGYWTQYFFPWLKNKTMFFFSPKNTIGLGE